MGQDLILRSCSTGISCLCFICTSVLQNNDETNYINDEHDNADEIKEIAENHQFDQSIDKTHKKGLKSKLQSIAEYVGLDLFRNKTYTLTAFASAFVTLPQQLTPTALPEHILWTGGSTNQAANTLVIIGIASIFSRLFLGRLSSENQRIRLNILILSSILSGTSLVCCFIYTSYWMYIVFSVLFGITKGILVIYFALFMVYVVGKERGHQGFGINYTIKGIVLLVGMPVFGAVADHTFKTWGYNFVFICLGVAEIISSLIFLTIRFFWMREE